ALCFPHPELAICSGLRVELSEPTGGLLSGSLLSDSRRLRDLFTSNRCGEVTSASLVSFRWTANRLSGDFKVVAGEVLIIRGVLSVSTMVTIVSTFHRPMIAGTEISGVVIRFLNSQVLKSPYAERVFMRRSIEAARKH